MNYKWTILEVFAQDEVITGAKYHLIGIDNDISVETEGNFYFDCPVAKVPFAEVTEEMLIEWIEDAAIQNGVNHIKTCIENQINALKLYKSATTPWLLQETFTVE